ncbi:hypothetical protein D3C85_1216100 [compost metagenome]
MLRLDVKTVDVVEQAVEGLQHHRHVPVESPVIGLLLTIQRHQRIAHHPHTVGVGEGDRAGQQAGFANPLQTGGVAVAVEDMHAGEARPMGGGTRTRLDQGDPGVDVAAFRRAPAHIAVADAHAGYIGDGVERAGLQLAELDVQIAGTKFHGCSHG